MARRHFGYALAAGGILAAVILVLVFSGGGDESEAPFAPIAQAAERTARIPGARVEVQGTLDLPGRSLTITMHGQGAYNGKTDRGTLRLRVDYPGTSQDFTSHQVSDGLVTYLRMPAFEGELPEGKNWLKLDFSEYAANATLGTGGDPRQQLRQLRAVSSDAQRVGEESVRGLPTLHYSATIDPQRAAEELREAGADEAADDLEALGYESPVDVWIDKKGNVRRLVSITSFAALTGESSTMTMREELYDFGVKPRISLPPEDEVFDGTELSQEALDAIAP